MPPSTNRESLAPDLVIHCDWGTQPKKRWMAKAVKQEDGYHVGLPEPVGNLNGPDNLQKPLATQIRHERGDHKCALVGFDFPIGIPSRYAHNAKIREFKPFLKSLGKNEWSMFFEVADTLKQVSLHRPFYPNSNPKKGEVTQAPFLKALKAQDINDLRRRCEKGTELRGAACPLFWTIGGNQVGKAAICGWKNLISQIVNDEDVKLWPFDGRLDQLLKPGNLVIGETYPTQYHRWILGGPFQGKRLLSKRRNVGQSMLDWAVEQKVQLQNCLRTEIEAGFPPKTRPGQPRADGQERRDNEDDRFDAILGLFGMLHLILRPELNHEPSDPEIQTIEGWILGQSQVPVAIP